MKIPLTKYGLPQVIVIPAIIMAIMIICPFTPFGGWIITVIELVFAALLVWALSFFRDPERIPPRDNDLLLSPADGTISDIEIVENEYVGQRCLRIGIFLSIFNVHINRAPCDVQIEKIFYKKGKYKNAMNPDSARVNESNDLWLTRTSHPADKLIVRQISGAIARRIVCKADVGDRISSGEKFGMIKFGSRTELYLPCDEKRICLVKIGDKVKAGLTPLVRYQNEEI